MKTSLPPRVVESRGHARGLDRPWSYLELTRWNSAPLAALPTGVGALAAGFDLGRTAAAVVLGMAVHCCNNIVNGLADVEQDRLDPRRRDDALVSGAVSRHQAMLVAMLLLIVIGPLAVVIARNSWATSAYLVLVGLYLYANLFQKRSAHVGPAVMDLVFGLVIAGPMVVVAWSSGQRPPAALVLVACGMLFQIAVVNLLVARTVDLKCDLESGVRTSAIEFGVRVGEGGPLFSRKFTSYAFGLQGGVVVAGLAAGVLGTLDRTAVATIALSALGAVLLLAGTFNVVSLVGARFPSVTSSSWAWFAYTNYLSAVAFAAAAVGPAKVLALFGAVVVVTGLSVALSRHPGASVDRLLRFEDAMTEFPGAPAGKTKTGAERRP